MVYISLSLSHTHTHTYTLFLFVLMFHDRYTFYDGPPFATGTPHYGHILAGTIKVGE